MGIVSRIHWLPVLLQHQRPKGQSLGPFPDTIQEERRVITSPHLFLVALQSAKAWYPN
jgi:hypothetical protein